MSKLNPFHRGGICPRCGQQFDGFARPKDMKDMELSRRLGGKWLAICVACGAFMISADDGQRADPTPDELNIIRQFNAEMNDAGRLEHMKIVEPLYG